MEAFELFNESFKSIIDTTTVFAIFGVAFFVMVRVRWIRRCGD